MTRALASSQTAKASQQRISNPLCKSKGEKGRPLTFKFERSNGVSWPCFVASPSSPCFFISFSSGTSAAEETHARILNSVAARMLSIILLLNNYIEFLVPLLFHCPSPFSQILPKSRNA